MDGDESIRAIEEQPGIQLIQHIHAHPLAAQPCRREFCDARIDLDLGQPVRAGCARVAAPVAGDQADAQATCGCGCRKQELQPRRPVPGARDLLRRPDRSDNRQADDEQQDATSTVDSFAAHRVARIIPVSGCLRNKQ